MVSRCRSAEGASASASSATAPVLGPPGGGEQHGVGPARRRAPPRPRSRPRGRHRCARSRPRPPTRARGCSCSRRPDSRARTRPRGSAPPAVQALPPRSMLVAVRVVLRAAVMVPVRPPVPVGAALGPERRATCRTAAPSFASMSSITWSRCTRMRPAPISAGVCRLPTCQAMRASTAPSAATSASGSSAASTATSRPSSSTSPSPSSSDTVSGRSTSSTAPAGGLQPLPPQEPLAVVEHDPVDRAGDGPAPDRMRPERAHPGRSGTVCTCPPPLHVEARAASSATRFGTKIAAEISRVRGAPAASCRPAAPPGTGSPGSRSSSGPWRAA